MREIVIATGNHHKFRELRALLTVRGIRWRALTDYPGVSAVRETGKNFETNAAKKARAVAKATGQLALADDSGLEVAALHWGPGVRSARFAGAHGDDAANNRKLLRVLHGLPRRRRGARYRCILALASPTKLLAVTSGTWSGQIAEAPKGRNGFGYDPLFLVPGTGKTVAQLPVRLKHQHSHRAAAARRMKAVLKKLTAGTRG